MATLKVNGESRTVDVPDQKPLLWVLRENLGLKGAKYGCGIGLCGACTVLMDGRAVRSCVTPSRVAEGNDVQTIEGLDDELGQELKEAWVRNGVAQCGYCQTGQIMAAYDLISNWDGAEPLAFREQLTNLCRCGTYSRIHQALEEIVARRGGG